MKRYVRYVCTVCKRITDKQVDNSRFSPDLCTITLRCPGRLVPVEYRSDAQITTAPQVGLTDWAPRQTALTLGNIYSETTNEPALINTASGTYAQVVLAIKLDADPGPLSTAVLTLKQRNDLPKEYKQYVFRRDLPFTTISGVESGLAQKVLQFQAYGSDPDLVEVYVNGKKLEEGTAPDQFQVYDGTPSSAVPPNTIQFNTSITNGATSQVDITVSKEGQVITTPLTFVRNVDDSNRIPTGSWENISHIERFSDGAWHTYYLFRYDILNSSGLTLNTILSPYGEVSVSGVSPDVALSDVHLLLAREPYTQVDRYPNISVPLNTMSLDRDYFKYHLIDKTPTLEVAETAMQSFFPTARLHKFNAETTIKTAVAGQTEQLVVDGTVVVGPDV